ncbi:hypothetical protein ACN47E_005950 [Coniothyrium glycines]
MESEGNALLPDEIDKMIAQCATAPASAEVYQEVCIRRRSLRDLKQLLQGATSLARLPVSHWENGNPKQFPGTEVILEAQTKSTMEDQDVRKAARAQQWLLAMLTHNEKLLSREQELRTLRRAVENGMLNRGVPMTDLERILLALSDYNMPSPMDRLDAATQIILHIGVDGHLDDVRRRTAERVEQFQRAESWRTSQDEVYEELASTARMVTVDHFACAIPLAQLKASGPSSVVDDNAGCCPVCQQSYTDVTNFTAEDLLEDYPVRIKHCGHVIGRSCLSKWMDTPKIDEAKYPYRTCPMCRVKLEGVVPPKIPTLIREHLHRNRHAIATIQALTMGWDLEFDECVSSLFVVMSRDIACSELVAEFQRQKINNEDGAFDTQVALLNAKAEGLKKEKWAWGFRGHAVWKTLRTEWMNSGVVTKD